MRIVALIVTVALSACTTETTDKSSDTDTDTMDTDTMDTDTMDSDMMTVDYDALACEQASAAATTLVAGDAVDAPSLPSLALDLPQLVTLPASGVGFVQIVNDDHRDVILYTGVDADVTAVHDGGGGSTALDDGMPVGDCPTELAGGVRTHLHPQTWILELHGPASADAWLLVFDGGDHDMGGMDTDMGM